MARNPKKYVYLTIGILRDSQTHKDLIADAEEHNTKHLPTVAGIRLSEYYRLRRQGLLGTVPTSQDMPSTQDIPNDTSDDVGSEYSDAFSNAAEADNAWPDD
jgi:hypothetical protein